MNIIRISIQKCKLEYFIVKYILLARICIEEKKKCIEEIFRNVILDYFIVLKIIVHATI